jgi:hypothetical protein
MSNIINASTSAGLIHTADTSGTIELQSNGTTQLTVASTGAYGQLKSGTAVASTSGTSIDFTSIPSWVKRVTVMLNAVSTNGTSNIVLQVGAGSVTTTGYVSSHLVANTTFAGSGATSTTNFVLNNVSSSGDVAYCQAVLTNISGNNWVLSSIGNAPNASGRTTWGGGGIALGGTLDRVRITTNNGTDTFDAGSINILYEG